MAISFSPSILYVDDSRDTCEMVKIMLRVADEKYQVTTVCEAGEAVYFINNLDFDLYVLDFRLPEVSGVDLCRQIRQRNPNALIIFFTAMAQDICRAEALNAGANDYLVKPNDLPRFTETVRHLLDGEAFFRLTV